MDLMAQCGDEYKISLDPSYRRGNYPEKWRYYEIRGKDGTLWPYSETHLVVLFYHSWRSRIDADGDVIWIPSRRSQKAKRFQTLVRDDGEVVQDCDEATCIKAPNKYLSKALRFIDAQRKRRVSEAVKARLAQASKSRPLIIAGKGLTGHFLNDLPLSVDLTSSESFMRDVASDLNGEAVTPDVAL